MRPDTLGVIGLGAIGGSVAWQAAHAGIPRIVGFAANTNDGAAAVRAGAVTELAHNPRDVARAADFLVLATPPKATLDLLEALSAALAERDAYCTDVMSAKGAVVALAERLNLADRFAGSHPFAGTHHAGFGAARPDRFSDRVVYVTPLSHGDHAAREVADFWKRVMGAHTVTLSADRHDQLLAWTSHLPQAVSSALAAALAAQGPRGASYASGALSTTRLAASSVDMWTDLLLLNRDNVLASLEAFGASVGELKKALTARDAGALRQWLESGAQWRSRLGS